MKKGTRIVKKLLALFLVVLMSINTFAAVVGDNDGAAFITKAEFDSLKNDFQSQLVRYNSSIDNKIDGAIASYLAGVNVKSESRVTPLCYFDGEHIYSLRENYQDVNWSEGLMSISMVIDYMTRNGNNWLSGQIGVKGQTPKAYKELAIGTLSRDTTTPDKSRALWKGLREIKYTINLHGANQNWNWTPGTAPTTLYAGPGYGFCALSNVANFWTYRSGTGAGKAQFVVYVLGTTTTNAWSYSESDGYYNITEELINTTHKHLVVNNSNTCKRFTNADGYTDCNYDSDGYGTTSIHTQWTNGNQVFADSYTGNVTYVYNGSSQTVAPVTKVGNTHSTNSRDHEFPWHRCLPWNGFIKELQNWNQIATSDYDALATSLKAIYDTDSYYKDKNNKIHLLLCAGVPIFYNESGKEVELAFDVEFADKSKSYALFLKDTPFVKGVNPEAEANYTANDVIKGKKENGTHATQALFNNSILVENGIGTYRVTLKPQGCLFMKWRFNDSSVTGGGELIPPQFISTFG